MNGLDEARYGRACLLVLNICAFTLRQVIEDYYGRQGSLSLQDFLIRNKHNLFHLLRKQCCCQHPHNASTPMNKGQWDILYMSTRTSCSKSQRGDCPCLYDVKPNITTDDMDVTLCCLFLHNLCPGINMADVRTIREVRNKLMHADTAELDEPTYRQYWTNVKTSVLNLARSVSVRLHTVTLDKIQKLEQQLMNSADLGELRKLIIDQKKFQELETDVALATQTMSVMQDTANETTQAVAQNAQKITQVADLATETIQEVKQVVQKVLHVEERMNQTVHDIIPALKDIPKPKKNIDVSRLKQRLIQVNNDITKVIPLSPLRERGENELPIELLFAEVVIIEDPKYREKGLSLPRQGKNVTDPDDIFKMHDEEVRQVYMLGDAAHGKTTYCIWLIKNWCYAQNAYPWGSEKVNKWERALNEFDYVFLLQFRHINPKRTSVIEMICKDVFGSEQALVATIRHVLSSDQYRSLIIMDGLDEWNPNEKARKQLTCQGIPNIEGISSSVSCFFSMRPWVFSIISKNVKISDRVIEIYGLSRDGIKNVVENVLLHHCKLKDDMAKSTKKEIMKHLNEKNILSFMKIPLLAVVCVQLWCKCKQVADSMTSFYAAMLNMLIERANEKHKLVIYNRKSVDCRLPEILSHHENIKNCVSSLLKLGKVAYEGLLSNETNLVFEKRKLERQVGEAELQFALDIGLISQKEAISIVTKNVRVHFFHKSIQEFLAAMYVTSDKNNIGPVCKFLSNVKVVMMLSNVIKFICGMYPSLGSEISKYVVDVIDRDATVRNHRESPCINEKVSELYHLQLTWYREIRCGQRGSPVAFHFSDIYLNGESDIETVRLTKEVLSDHNVDIRSLWLWRVPTDRVNSLNNSTVSDFLSDRDRTRSLVMVHIDGLGTDMSLLNVCGERMRTVSICHVKVSRSHISRGRNICYPLLKFMTSLRVLYLNDMALGDRGLGLSADMTDLQNIQLSRVDMSIKSWQQFILSIQEIQHRFNVLLFETNIDDASIKHIRSCRNYFKMKRDGEKYLLEFLRVGSFQQRRR